MIGELTSWLLSRLVVLALKPASAAYSYVHAECP